MGSPGLAAARIKKIVPLCLVIDQLEILLFLGKSTSEEEHLDPCWAKSRPSSCKDKKIVLPTHNHPMITHTHTHTHTHHTHPHTHTHTHTHRHTQTHTDTHRHTQTPTYPHTHT